MQPMTADASVTIEVLILIILSQKQKGHTFFVDQNITQQRSIAGITRYEITNGGYLFLKIYIFCVSIKTEIK